MKNIEHALKYDKCTINGFRSDDGWIVMRVENRDGTLKICDAAACASEALRIVDWDFHGARSIPYYTPDYDLPPFPVLNKCLWMGWKLHLYFWYGVFTCELSKPDGSACVGYGDTIEETIRNTLAFHKRFIESGVIVEAVNDPPLSPLDQCLREGLKLTLTLRDGEEIIGSLTEPDGMTIYISSGKCADDAIQNVIRHRESYEQYP